MTKKDYKPSDFAMVAPMDSLVRKSEAETVARNIMVILCRTGDAWRRLRWNEYRTERKKDCKQDVDVERPLFNSVVGYTVSAMAAVVFSPEWAKAAGIKA